MNLKNTLQFVAAFAFAISLSASAQAGEKKFEIWTGGLTQVGYTLAGTTGLNANIGGGSSAAIGYLLGDNLEAVFTPTLIWSNAGGSLLNFNPRVGLNYSFGGAMDDAMFLQLDVGFNISSNSITAGGVTVSTSSTNFALDAQFGKRYKIVDGVTYAPAARFDWTNGTAAISVIPVQFSFMM